MSAIEGTEDNDNDDDDDNDDGKNPSATKARIGRS
jgi:hypothetical protein